MSDARYWNPTTVRQLERDSIRRFLEEHKEYLHGTVLDWGCGRQPYRDIVLSAGGTYYGYDRPDLPGSVVDLAVIPEQWAADTILMTQVIQYAPDPWSMLLTVKNSLVEGGFLVMTGPGNWAEVESADLHRFTKAGIRDLLHKCGYRVIILKNRASIDLNGFELSLGWGLVATV